MPPQAVKLPFLSIIIPTLILIEVCHTAQKTDFQSLILQAEADVIDLTAPSDLFSSKAFVKIYDHPASSTSAAIEFLKDPEKTVRQKQIVVYSLQKLPWKNYFEVLSEATEAFEKRQLEAPVVGLLISPPLDWSTEVCYRYQDKRLINLLSRLSPGANTNLKKTIDEIISGSAWESAKSFPWSKPPNTLWGKIITPFYWESSEQKIKPPQSP
jgi:hypothetical protein